MKYVITINDANRFLKLDEEDAKRYIELCHKFNKIINEDFTQEKKIIREMNNVIKNKKNPFNKYRELTDGYSDILLKLYEYPRISKYEFKSVDTYELLLENYDRKDELIKLFNKLSELNLYNFIYNPDANLDGEYIICNDNKKEKELISTDGKVSFLPNIEYSNNVFPIMIKDATFIFKYIKDREHIFSKDELYVNNLFFDISKLPSNEQKFKGESFIDIDYEAVERNNSILLNEEIVVDKIESLRETKNLLKDLVNELLFLNEVLNEKDKDLVNLINDINELVKIKTDIDTIEKNVYDNSRNIITNAEIEKRLIKRYNEN